jgi:hypothetical protein
METRRQPKPRKSDNVGKKRFQIVKLEERVAPGHHNATSTSSFGYTSGPGRGGG